jgi:hypothetical protein
MITGMYLMTSIGITVDCEQICIRWGGTEIQLKTRTTFNDNVILHMLYHAANEPDILQESGKRQHRILDADYRKVEVDPYVQELAHLTKDEKQVLGETLKKSPTLFGGGLGMLNIKAVKLELIDGTKHYHARPFPVARSLEATTKTEMKRLTDNKLLPLPQPPVRARTDARTNPSAQRATQLRRVLARVYAVSIQNQTTTTVP